MLASELIEELQKIIAENGDVEINLWPDLHKKAEPINEIYYSTWSEAWVISL